MDTNDSNTPIKSDMAENSDIDDDEFVTKKEFVSVMHDTGQQIKSALELLEENTKKRENDLTVSMQTALNDMTSQLNKKLELTPQDSKNDLLNEGIGLVKEYIKTQGAPSDDKSFLEEWQNRSKKEALESMDIVSMINKRVKANLVKGIAEEITSDVTTQTTPEVTHGA